MRLPSHSGLSDIPMPVPAPLPLPSVELAQQHPVVLLAMTVFGEARGAGEDAQLAVANVVRDRLQYPGEFGDSYTAVLIRPGAFDALQPGNPNYHKILVPTEYENPEVWDACFRAAFKVYTNHAEDNTHGAVFFHDESIDGPPPVWGHVLRTVVFGGLTFYRKA